MNKSPIITLPVSELEAFTESGIVLLRVQSKIVGVAIPVKPAISFKRGAPAEVIRDEYLKWKESHEN